MNHVQQIAASGLMLLFGLLALAVWRRGGRVRRDRGTLAWGLTAAGFLVMGGYGSAHAVISAGAVAAGHDSALFQWVSGWVVAANLARGAVSVAFAALLLAVLTVPRRWLPPVGRAAPVVLGAVAVVGTALALRLPSSTVYWLGTGLAVLSTATAVLLMAALLAGLLNDGMDLLLWAAVAAYALKETVSVSLFAVLAWWSLAADAFAFRMFYWLGVVLVGAMAALAARRLRLAVAGRHVPPVFEGLHTFRHSPAR